MGRFDKLPGIDSEQSTTRRNALIGGGYIFGGAMLLGIIGNLTGAGDDDTDDENDVGTLDGWDIADAESDAWEDTEFGVEVARAIDEHDEATLEEAYERLDNSRDAWDDLRDGVDDNLEGDMFFDINDYFLTLRGAATAGRNAVGAALDRDVPGGDDPDDFLPSMEEHWGNAADMYDEIDELQDATDGDRF